jgi:quinoprotein glucose dehydrogenase
VVFTAFVFACIVSADRSIKHRSRQSVLAAEKHPQEEVGWKVYNGSKGNSHYSPLSQINTSNVSQLKQAWRFDAGDAGGLQTNPLVIGNTLYA